MIPSQNIIAWSNIAPWAELRQIEQDLIISRAVIELFSDEFLKDELRALLQRDKGRDLFDLSHALIVFADIDTDLVSSMFVQYLDAQKQKLSRAQAEERMFAKLINPGFLADIRPLLSVEQAEKLTDKAMKAAFANVFTGLVGKLPGKTWARTNEMAKRFEIDLSA